MTITTSIIKMASRINGSLIRGILIVLAIPLTIALFRAIFIYKSAPPPRSCLDTPGHHRIKLTEQALNRFKEALNIPTISYKRHHYEPEQLVNLINHIERSFPQVHNSQFIKREFVANYTLVYTIQGTNQQLRPYLLTAHLDVVPVVREKWSSDPFQAVVKEDKNIYARGTIDAKDLLMSMLEALELKLSSGFRPNRGFYLVFGHDEEIGGEEGAQAVAKLLAHRIKESSWEKLEYILDEGNIISKTPISGINAAVALVGVVEKGYATMKVSAQGSVGHGSMPPPKTAITKLSKAISKFHSHLLPSFFGQGVEREMIETFAMHSSWPHKFVYANFWLFKPIFEYMFSNDPPLNSLIRTSTAVTMISGGTKENVLPDSATAFINHRVHPLQSINDVLEYDKKIIDDPTIQIEVHGHRNEPSPTAPYCDECHGYQLIKQSVLQVYPGTVVVPSTFLASSDSKWYTNLTDSIYKFSAIAVPMEEMNRFHGHDERISLENYENLINFFDHLMMNSDYEKFPVIANHKDEL